MMTGYYTISGETKRGKVHITSINGRPICGSHLHENAEFQWCASGIKLDYVECKHCIKIGTKILSEFNPLDVMRGLKSWLLY